MAFSLILKGLLAFFEIIEYISAIVLLVPFLSDSSLWVVAVLILVLFVVLSSFVVFTKTKIITPMIIAQIHHFFNKGFVFLAPQFGHIFKKELGISLHQYITQKRLLYARKLIKEG
ncbi:MAG: hypothetical protein UH854_01920, partial [Clostridia bacterium]|nr:hypothetical protein [Clostridia bacterium]